MSRHLSPAERRLHEARLARDAARARVMGTMARLRPQMNAGAITARLKADAAHAARNAAMEALEIAADERGIVAGTVAALAAWLARGQIMRGARALWQRWQARAPGAGDSE